MMHVALISFLWGLVYLENAEGLALQQRNCFLSITDNLLKPFYSLYRPYGSVTEFPCSYKLTSMECGEGRQVVVWAENSWDENETPYMSTLTVNITTGGDNETKTTQINSITTDSIAKFLESGDTEKGTPWEWSCPDCASKPDPYITGQFNRTTKVARLSLEELKITFESVNKTLTIFCGHDHFVILETQPGAYCGGLEWPRTDIALAAFRKDNPSTDEHHLGYKHHYAALAKQNVTQLKPLCQEATQMVTSQAECPDVGEVIFECGSLFGTPTSYNKRYSYSQLYHPPFQLYSSCIKLNRMNRFKVYVTCLRLLCGASSGRTPATEDCGLLKEVDEKCQNLTGKVHTNMTVLMSRAGCHVPVTPELKELGASCTERSECGKNARCKGTPLKCTCKSGYVSNDGKHCGLLVEKTCSRNGQCVPNAKCKNGTCQCKNGYTASEIKFCVKRLGKRCSCDCECMKRAECVHGRCRCRSGYVQPDYDNTQCKLAPGQECRRKADCGANAKCKGDPPRCTCQQGYVDEQGRCGKPVGSNCTFEKECVTNTYCWYNKPVCHCIYGYEKSGDFCVWNEVKYCEYNSFHGKVEKFHRTVTNAKRYYYAFPCAYKMADIQCSGARVVVTINHAIQEMNRRAQRWHSSRGIYIGDVTVNVTTVNDDGSLTSQINWLDATTFRKYARKGNHSVSPWKWSYTGSTEPQGEDRIHGYFSPSYGHGSAIVGYKRLRVSYATPRKTLRILCGASDFKGLAKTHDTICGGPWDSDDALLRDIVSRSKMDSHHHLAPVLLDVYIALAKQDIPQTDPQCQEAREVLTGRCDNLGESLYDCFSYYAAMMKCLRLKEMDSFQPFVECLRVLCGQTGGDTEESCGIFQTAQDACVEEVKTSHIPVWKLMKMANCTAATPPP